MSLHLSIDLDCSCTFASAAAGFIPAVSGVTAIADATASGRFDGTVIMVKRPNRTSRMHNVIAPG